MCHIEEIIVYGHSCAIDFDYFKYLNIKYPTATWVFYAKEAKQENNIRNLIMEYDIRNANIIKIQ